MRDKIVSIIKLLLVFLLSATLTTSCGAYRDNSEDDDSSNKLYPPIDESIKVVEIPIVKEGDI